MSMKLVLQVGAVASMIVMAIVVVAPWGRQSPQRPRVEEGAVDLATVQLFTERFEGLVTRAADASDQAARIVDATEKNDPQAASTFEGAVDDVHRARSQESIWRTLYHRPQLLSPGDVLGSIELNPFAYEVSGSARDALSQIIAIYQPVLAEMGDVAANIQGNEHAAHLKAGRIEDYRIDEDPLLRDAWEQLVRDYAQANDVADVAEANEWLLVHAPLDFVARRRMSVTSVTEGEHLAYPLHCLPEAQSADDALRACQLDFVSKLSAWSEAQGLISSGMAMELLTRYQ